MNFRIYRRSYRDRLERKRRTTRWTVEFRDPRTAPPLLRRLAVYPDKTATFKFGERVMSLLARLIQGLRIDDPDLLRWIDGLTPDLRQKLLEYDLLDSQTNAGTRPLLEHVTDYRQALEAEKRDPRHVAWTISQIEKVVRGCQFRAWSDIDAHQVKVYLDGLKVRGENGKRKLSARSVNGYITAMKQFCNWAVPKRIPYSPLQGLEKLSITDAKERRALSLDELRILLVWCESHGPDRFGMIGKERAMLYRLAVETGLRSNELRSLTRASFELDDDEEPAVNLGAASTKARKAARLELARGTAAALRTFLENKLPAAPAFRMPPSTHTAEMLRVDLRGARAAWIKAADDRKQQHQRAKSDFLAQTDAAGRVVLFHSLRHTRGVWLFEHYNATPREVQALMRVSSIALVDRYAKSFKLAGRRLADRAPDLNNLPAIEPAKPAAAG
jgi:integrase